MFCLPFERHHGVEIGGESEKGDGGGGIRKPVNRREQKKISIQIGHKKHGKRETERQKSGKLRKKS